MRPNISQNRLRTNRRKRNQADFLSIFCFWGGGYSFFFYSRVKKGTFLPGILKMCSDRRRRHQNRIASKTGPGKGPARTWKRTLRESPAIHTDTHILTLKGLVKVLVRFVLLY